MIRRDFIAKVILFVFTLPLAAMADDSAASQISFEDGVQPFLRMLTGQESQFELRADVQVEIDGRPQAVKLHLSRFDDVAFDLSLTHADYAVEIRRRSDSTTMILPKHNVAFVGRGDVPSELSLGPKDITTRLISTSSRANEAVTALFFMRQNADVIAAGAQEFLKLRQNPDSKKWFPTADSPVQFPEQGKMRVEAKSVSALLQLSTEVGTPAKELPEVQIVEIPRAELEQTLSRGVHRATEVLAPNAGLTKPIQENRKVPHGELRWIEGQRVVILDGTPEEIGTAHGNLLQQESRRCIESVLFSFGTVHAIRTGRWFRHDLKDAYARLSPHIPERHKAETRALAVALNTPTDIAEALNVFPEMFHCSGFAAFGSATADGKLYHGRVLDYMTTIGLQDAATTFIVKPAGFISFANVGYAAFIGSVSGMNSKAVSLGEMGGAGEGNWDGVPMATLMRRAMEECSTLDQVITLWTDSPRTCEYYYVFADGKTNQAVGVAAYPEKIEFIQPGQTHERLGEGIPDTVVLSAGSRLEKLRERVLEKHGKIDAEVGKWLMSRPVAMQSNLHNVLFVPQDGVLYVANASHSKPAAEQPYVKLNLFELLGTPQPESIRAAAR